MLYLILSLFSVTCYPASEFEVAKASIIHIQTNLVDKEANVITHALLKHSSTYQLDWKIMASIIAQESTFKKDPQNCLHRKHNCADLGISQINYATWSTELNLDRKKLLTDVDYNIEIMAKILSKLKEKYGNEKHWHTRYHSFTWKHRKIYSEFIYHYYLKISSYAKGYQDRDILAEN